MNKSVVGVIYRVILTFVQIIVVWSDFREQ